MIRPEELSAAAEKKQKENLAFRRYLKIHADPQKLDRQFLRLHTDLFSKYDCNACRNCCKVMNASISEEELPDCAKQLAMEPEEFKAKYLTDSPEGGYEALHTPCDFLNEDGSCMLGKQKPENCADFPFTQRPDRIGSLLGIVENTFVCPVVYEMLEQLKEEYGFVYYRGKRKR